MGLLNNLLGTPTGYSNPSRLNNSELDMFSILGLSSEFASGDPAKKQNIPIARYLKIVLRESELMNPSKTNDADKYKIILPYNSDKGISDTISARISNTWDSSNSGVVGTTVTRFIQKLDTSDLMNDWSKGSGILSFIQSNVMFKYDGSSTRKTLQVPFIVPLGMATREKLDNGAARNARFIMNKLEGLLYPNDSIAYMPPLMELTVGGMYQSFYGFVTSVNINPTNPDMFMDIESGQYFNLVYEGTITFENLFTYYHSGISSEEHADWDIDNTDISVLFGHDNLPSYTGYTKVEYGEATYTGSKASADAINNILYGPVVTRITPPTIGEHPVITPTSVTLVVPYVFATDPRVSNAMSIIRTKDINDTNISIINSLNDTLQTTLNNYSAELTRDPTHGDAIFQTYVQQVRTLLERAINDLS